MTVVLVILGIIAAIGFLMVALAIVSFNTDEVKCDSCGGRAKLFKQDYDEQGEFHTYYSCNQCGKVIRQ